MDPAVSDGRDVKKAELEIDCEIDFKIIGKVE